MKKHWMLILLSSLMLFSCYDPNEWWTEEETKSMVQYAKNIFTEVKDIVLDYNGTIVDEHYDENLKKIQCHYYHFNSLAYELDDISYEIKIDLTPENNVSVHEFKLWATSPMYSAPNECVFKKEQYLVMNDLLESFDKIVNVKSFISLDQIEENMHIAKDSYIESKGGGSYEVKINNQYHMVDYKGRFAFAKKNDASLYYNSFSLEFSKCPDRFY